MSPDVLESAIAEAGPIIRKRYQQRLRSIQHRFDVDDLVQVTSMKASRKYDTCRGQSIADVRNWILKIAHNSCRSAIVTHKKTAKRSTEAESAEVCEQPGPAEERPDTLVTREQMKQVLSCLDRLSPQRRSLVVMYYLRQMSYSEIAGEVGISTAFARCVVQSAIAELRLEMQQPGLFDLESESCESTFAG